MGRNSGKRSQAHLKQKAHGTKKVRLNKMNRKAERQQNRKIQKAEKKARQMTQDEEEVENRMDAILSKSAKEEANLTRESFARRREQKRALLLTQLENSIASEEKRLACWYPGKEEYLARKERLRTRFDPNKPRGAARPAEEAYPDLYPEYHAEKERKENEEREADLNKGDNYLEMYDKHWGNHETTRKLMSCYLEAAVLKLEDVCRKSRGKLTDAISKFEKVLDMDEDRHISLRTAWFAIACHVEMENLSGARVLIEKELANTKSHNALSHMLLWDMVLINFIGCRVLEEKDTTEDELHQSLEVAMAHNPYISKCLMLHSKYESVINGDVVDDFIFDDLDACMKRYIEKGARDASHPRWNLEEQSIVYFVRAISWWRDAGEESIEWIRDYVMQNADKLADFDYERTHQSSLVQMYDSVSLDADSDVDEEESEQSESEEDSE